MSFAAPTAKYVAVRTKRTFDEDVETLTKGDLQKSKMASGKYACPFPACIYNKEGMVARQIAGEPSHKLYFGTKWHLMEHMEKMHRNMYKSWTHYLN